jgi:hypothetical protein
MRQDAPRHDVDPDDRLSDFDSEDQSSAFDETESDVEFHTNEHGAARTGSESGAIYDSRELDIVLGSKEPDGGFRGEDLDIVFNKPERDIGPRTWKRGAHVRPVQTPSVHAPSAQLFSRYTSGPVVQKSAPRHIGIALLILGGIAVAAWAGLLLMGLRRDAGTSGAQVQHASQPTPTVAQEAPTTVLPPAPDPQPPAPEVPAATATSSEPATGIATPSEARDPSVPDLPRATQPARQTEQLPVTADPNAPGGLFAITRPLGAQVFVDDKLIGTTPLFMSHLSAGSHQVRLELPGFNPYSSSIQVQPNERFRLAVQLDGTR